MKKYLPALLFCWLSLLSASAQRTGTKQVDIPSAITTIKDKTILELGIDLNKSIGKLNDLYGPGFGASIGIKRNFSDHVGGLICLGDDIMIGDKLPGTDTRRDSKNLIRGIVEIEVCAGSSVPLYGRVGGGIVNASAGGSSTTSFGVRATAGCRINIGKNMDLGLELDWNSFEFGNQRYNYLGLGAIFDIDLKKKAGR